jgi:acyl carrier protein
MRSAYDEAKNLLESVFGRSLTTGETPQLGVTPEWDSLNSIEMIFLLEEKYDVEVGIERWDSVFDIDSLSHLIQELRLAWTG